jgi:hypothetical protein
MMNSVFNTPMFNMNTDLENTYFLTKEEAEAKLVTDKNVGCKKEEGVQG